MAAVFERYPVGGGEFALALALADNAHEDGSHIFPSVGTMAAKSRQSVRAVQRQLRGMVASGWLQRTSAGLGGRGKATEYRINPRWLKGEDLTPFSGPVDNSQKGADLAPFEPEKGCHSRQKRVPNEAQKGAIQSTPYITGITSIEPNPPCPPTGGARTRAMDSSAQTEQAGAGSCAAQIPVAREGDGCADGFEEFFAAFPRQVARSKARREWARVAPDAELRGRIMVAVRAWTRSAEWQRMDGQFVPKPDRWLREERWADVPGIAPVAAATPATPPPRLAAQLTPEQLLANRSKAAAAALHARSVLAPRRSPERSAA